MAAPISSKSQQTVSTEVEDRTVCFCHNVPLTRLMRAIGEGAITLEQIQEVTCASTGCGGCEFEVRAVLEEELARRAQI